MADPLSITASVIAVVTVAVQSTKSLYETVKRFKDRSKTLHRLQEELEDLTNILNSLTQVNNAETSLLELLQSPVSRCGELCREFEQSMKVFSGNSKVGFRDWAKMEFMRGDMNEFIDTIGGYKSTITVGLGTITLHTSKVSQKVLQDYNEMIQNTAYNLEVHMCRIDEKLARFSTETANSSDISIDLKDERAVTKQCISICEDARSYIESLTNRESTLLQETPQNATDDDAQHGFEAQLLARQALDENRDSLAGVIRSLKGHLESLILNGDSENVNERSRLQADIDIAKQCLDVCKVASEVSHRKIYRIGEVIADGDSDQVVVTSLADLFDIKKALSKGNSAQLIGSMSEETLRHMADKRYSSRFGTSASSSVRVLGGTNANLPSVTETQKGKSQTGDNEQSPSLEARRSRPSPNEMRRRE